MSKEVCYDKKLIHHLSELKPGDHIKTNRKAYDHHMLVVSVISDTKLHVIHYDQAEESEEPPLKFLPKKPPPGVVREAVIEVNPTKIELLIPNPIPETLCSVEEVFARARSRLGERKYNLFTNNCEHFVNWAKAGRAASSQQNVVKTVTDLGIECGVDAAFRTKNPIVGVATGLGNALFAYKLFRDGENKTKPE